VQVNDLDLDQMSGSIEVSLDGAAVASKDGAQQVGLSKIQRAEKALQDLLAKDRDSAVDRLELRKELLRFLDEFPTTHQARRAQALWNKLPSPLDALDPRKIPAEELRLTCDLDLAKAPQNLVAIFGSGNRWQSGTPGTEWCHRSPAWPTPSRRGS